MNRRQRVIFLFALFIICFGQTNAQQEDKLLMNTFISEWYGGTWGPYSLINYQYDAANRLSSDLLQHWDGFEFVNAERNTFEWEDSLVSKRVQTRWLKGKETNIKKFLYEYNENGQRTRETGFMWDSTDWSESWISEYEYDAEGKRRQWLYSEWTDGELRQRTRREYFYNEMNLLSRVDMYYMEDYQWQHKWIYEYEYDAQGLRSGYQSKTYRDGGWAPVVKGELIYNAEGKIAEEIVYYYSGEWTYYEKYIHEYDSEGYETRMVHQTANCGKWVNYLQEEYQYDSGNPAGGTEFGSPEFIVWPNPAARKLNVITAAETAEAPSITITGAGGREYEIPARNINYSGGEMEIDLPDLPRGAYFLRIDCGMNIYSKKIMIGE
jgi:hypothetical protein